MTYEICSLRCGFRQRAPPSTTLRVTLAKRLNLSCQRALKVVLGQLRCPKSDLYRGARSGLSQWSSITDGLCGRESHLTELRVPAEHPRPSLRDRTGHPRDRPGKSRAGERVPCEVGVLRLRSSFASAKLLLRSG